jgi:hypothetical protein
MSKDKDDWWDTHFIIGGVDKETSKKIKDKLKKNGRRT